MFGVGCEVDETTPEVPSDSPKSPDGSEGVPQPDKLEGNPEQKSPAWTFLDNGGVNIPSIGLIAAFPHAVVFKSNIYAAWHERGANSIWHINLAVFSPKTNSWKVLGTANGLNKDPNVHATFARLVVFNSKLYITWSEYNGPNQIRVAVYNGDDDAPDIAFLDGPVGLNRNPSNHAHNPQMTVFGSRLFLTWVEQGSTTSAHQLRVRVYNGNDEVPSWSFADGNLATGLNFDVSRGANTPQFGVFNSKLYLTWTENMTGHSNNVGVIRVKVYNGNDSSPNWSSVAGGGLGTLSFSASQESRDPDLVIFNNKLYAGWTEQTGVGAVVHIKVYNGNDSSPLWTSVDGESGLSVKPSATSRSVRFSVYNSKILVAWTEWEFAQTPLWVKSYNGDDSKPAWDFLGRKEVMLNCETGISADYSHLLTLDNTLYAISSQQCPRDSAIRLQSYGQ